MATATITTTLKDHISTLPPEILLSILSHLPPTPLLRFSRTSKSNHLFALSSLRSLTLGIHHSRISSLLSTLDALAPPSEASTSPWLEHSSNTCTVDAPISVLLPRGQTRTKWQVLTQQSVIPTDVIRRHGRSLRSINLAVWELSAPLATALAACSRLKNLALRMDHPHVRHPDLPKAFWDKSPPSTVWNNLSHALATSPLRDGPSFGGNLETIRFERAGITDFQLEAVLKENPGCKEVRLHKCFTITEEFFEALVRREERWGRGQLEVLQFSGAALNCAPEIIYECLGRLKGLKELNLHGCFNLDNAEMKRLNDEVWRVPYLVLPSSAVEEVEGDGNGGIEIDPRYKD